MSPVVALVAVRRAKKVAGRASSQESWSPRATAACNMVPRSRCIRSTWPFPFGLYPAVLVISIPRALPTSRKRWLRNCWPQSVWMASGIPNQAKISFSRVRTVNLAVALGRGKTSTHFEKASLQVRI